METIYISGKISEDKDYRKKFYKASKKLTKAGFIPIDPRCFSIGIPTWELVMRIVLREMLNSDGLALLPDWEESKGARIEERLAREVGIPVKPIEEWINGGSSR